MSVIRPDDKTIALPPPTEKEAAAARAQRRHEENFHRETGLDPLRDTAALDGYEIDNAKHRNRKVFVMNRKPRRKTK